MMDVVHGTPALAQATDLVRLARAIEQLGVHELSALAGPSTWSMPAADRCRSTLITERHRLAALAADLRHRAAQLTTTTLNAPSGVRGDIR
jgi:homoserine acetyltransferase